MLYGIGYMVKDVIWHRTYGKGHYMASDSERWMDGFGWMDGYIDGCNHGWMDLCTDGEIDR